MFSDPSEARRNDGYGSGRLSGDPSRAFAEVIAEAKEALRDNPSLFRVGEVIELYRCVMKLHSQAEKVRKIIAAKEQPNKEVYLTLGEQRAFLDLFDLVGEFDLQLSKLDMAIVDIYYPGLRQGIYYLYGEVGGVVDIDVQYEGIDQYRLDDSPVSLAHFLSDVRPWGYDNQIFTTYLKASFLNPELHPQNWRRDRESAAYLQARGHQASPSDQPASKLNRRLAPSKRLKISTWQLQNVRALCDGLSQVKEMLSDLVRSNWSLPEIAASGVQRNMSLEVVMGDSFSNISSSTIINRSLIERSFLQVNERFGHGTAEALGQLAQEIEGSGNRDAAENFVAFNEELQKPEPKKPILRSLWRGITESLPALTQMADLMAGLSPLLSWIGL